MGNGNIHVGNETPTRKPGQPTVESFSGSNGSSELRIDSPLRPEHPEICGAMSQQGGEFRGNISSPQEFLHLVGCRDPKVKSGPEVRQYSNRTKR